MKTWLDLKIGTWPLKRVTLHVAFWVIVYFMYTGLYAIQLTYATSIRNNLFYIPVHMFYYYTLAYWLVPRYLFNGRYIKFEIYLILLMIVSTLISRLVGIYIANPYILQHEHPSDWGFIEEQKWPLHKQLFNLLTFVNAWKAMNMVVWFALVLKMVKLWAERKQAALQAELNALKAQVHPHFLFNTLNNLYALTLSNSPKSSQVVLGLSDILRYMLYECNTENASVKQEVLVLQQYISLEKLRYEDRLDLNFTIEGDLENKFIAPLIMLPFVENAFKHGTSEKQGDVWININLSVSGNLLKFKVSNSKPDSSPADAQKHHGHIGLQNVKKRLELLYPSAHQLKIFDDDDAYLIVLELELNPQTKPQPQLAPHENTYADS
ncbi:sensor histidine kinase [Mucilaginibacter terrae]|uniref:Two-component system sensor histidine kinase AlgZ n=1 Tax=Mucilaginibacter terrae TaxID=1955052 RepID=A0ABU3H130_9SPHI|nr:histidine kinase [Mucilaginibacter terrae]MDT3404630.1 two-component system sensor histidine kinase AlgZ [Mucilaginibacter terrae]